MDDEYQEIQEDVEEDGSQDEEEVDELLPTACLPVSGAPMQPNPSEPAKDADEYLRQVQWERMHCPEVVEADIEEKPRRRKKRGLVGREGGLLAAFGCDLPAEAQPHPEWTADAAAAFRDLRATCIRLREEANGHQRFKFDEWKEKLKDGGRPVTDFLTNHDVVSINHLVVVAVELIQGAQEAAAVAAQEDGGSGNAAEVFASESGRLAEWAFAGLLYVEEPLVDDIQYQMQRLRRACTKAILATRELGGEASAPESASPQAPVDAVCGRAALILTIVSEVFGQR